MADTNLPKNSDAAKVLEKFVSDNPEKQHEDLVAAGMHQLGHDEAGNERLKELLRRPQQMIFAPAKALLAGEGAKSAAQQVLQAAQGNTHVSGGDITGQIQDNYNIQNPAALAGLAGAGAGLDVFADPVQHGMGAMAKAGKIPLSARVVDAAKAGGSYTTAKAILESGNPKLLNVVKEASLADLNQSIAGLRNTVSRGVPAARATLVAPEINTQSLQPGITGIVTGASEIAPRGIQPQNMSKVSLRSPGETMAEKVSDALSRGEKVGFSPGVSTQDQIKATKALEILKNRLK